MSKDIISFSEKEYKKWQKLLLESDEISRILWESFSISDIGFWKWDEKKRSLSWSKEVYRLLGLDPVTDTPSADIYFSFIPENDRHKFTSQVESAKDESAFAIEHKVVTHDKKTKILKVCGKWDECSRPGSRCCYGIIQDVTSYKIDAILHNFPIEIFDSDLIGFMITNPEHKIMFVNRAFTNITGYSGDEVLGQSSEILQSDRHDEKFYRMIIEELSISGKWKGESWNRRKNGEIYPEWLTINTIKDKNADPIGFISHFADLSEMRHKDAKLAEYAYSDVLTGSGNKEMFFISLDREIREAEEDHSQFAVAVLDINRFQKINESLGYAIGDRLLKLVAQRIREEIYPKDFLARFNGDSFYILIPRIGNEDILMLKVKRLVDRFKRPFSISGKNYFLSVSLGISIYPKDAKNRDTLIGRAEQAIQKAQMGGTDNYAFFSASPYEETTNYVAVENELRTALQNPDDALRTKFQPKVRLSTGTIDSLEALVRWGHPVKGLLPPFEFIHIAEETGLIVPIDMWVFKEVCRLSVKWGKIMGSPVRLAVNFSAKQYHRKALLSEIEKILDATGANPHNLIIEITETGIMTDFNEASAVLSNLKKLGFDLFVDDFGTGYSSLAYLREFPVDALKIDKSFIDDVLTKEQTAILVKTIIAMAHSLNLEVIAEGVENKEQQDFLAENDCDLIQGYIISTPMPSDSVINFLRSWKDDKPDALSDRLRN